MIYDHIENSMKYKGISPFMNKALEYIQKIDAGLLNPGRNDVDGDNLFVMMFDYTSIDDSEALYEIHKKYIDIQLVLKGKEHICCCPDGAPEVLKPYDDKDDAELFRLCPGIRLKLEPGVFALFMPEEYHAPKITINEKKEVRKIVVKIRV